MASFTMAGDGDLLRFAMGQSSPPSSYAVEGKAVGLLPDLIKAVFSTNTELNYSIVALPWARAQIMVQRGQLDALVTYPSENRKGYALFTQHEIHMWDYGYLIYSKNGPNAEAIAKASSFEDLRDFTLVAETKTGWEDDNIPQYIKRFYVIDPDAIMHSTFLRNNGDFFIMSPNDAVYFTSKHGYKSLLAIKRVDFIPNSKIPFHIGIRKDFPNAHGLIELIDETISSPEFQQKREHIYSTYANDV